MRTRTCTTDEDSVRDRRFCGIFKFTIAFVSFAIFSCGEDSKGVTFVVPEGFDGPFWIVVTSDGHTIDEAKRWHRITVPETKEIRVTSDRFLTQMRTVTCKTALGNVIPLSESSGEHEVALHRLGYHSRDSKAGRYEYFVGTKSQAEIWVQHRDGP